MPRKIIQNRCFLSLVATSIGLTLLGGGNFCPSVAAADSLAAEVTEEMIEPWLAITDVVLARHLDPPTRQELLKAAVQAVCQLIQRDAPRGLAGKLSAASSDDDLRAVLQATLAQLLAEHAIAPDKVRQAGVTGMLRRVAGVTNNPHGVPPLESTVPALIPLDDLRVQRQLRDNRYVGIGIQLATKDGYPVMRTAFPRGPAWKAGGRDGDLMITIDGLDAKNMSLARVVELLRGQEGKPTTVVVRQAGSAETRVLNMIRGVIPFDTVLGVERDENQNWRYRSKLDSRIGYLKIESFRGSTPSELRRISGQLHAADCQAVIVDLRGTKSGELRYVVMVADLLLGAGPIGQVLDARGRQQFDSSADQLFPGWPMVVLVDGRTNAEAEWIAAAVQDRGRGWLVGQPTAGRGAVMEWVELPGGIGGVQMNTGALFRAGGKAITQPMTQANAGAVPRRRVGANAMKLWAAGYRSGGLTPQHVVGISFEMREAVRLLQEKLGKASDAAEAPAAP